MSTDSIKVISERNFKKLFANLGYSRKEEGIYVRKVDDNFMLWIGTPSSVKGGVRAVSPVVGLRHGEVQNIISRLFGEKPHGYLPPTVSIGLGFLLPEAKWKEWYFDQNSAPSLYDDFLELLEKSAGSFVEEKASMHALEKMLQGYEFVRSKHDHFERLPVVKYLRGDGDGALQTLEEFVDLLKGKADPRSIQYCEKYAKNFRNLVLSGDRNL